MLQPWAIWRRVMRKRNKLQCCAPIVPWHPNSPGTFLANLGQLLRISFHDFNIFLQAPCAAWSWETTNWLWQRRNKPRRYDQLGPKRIFEWPTHWRPKSEASEQGECWRMERMEMWLGIRGNSECFLIVFDDVFGFRVWNSLGFCWIFVWTLFPFLLCSKHLLWESPDGYGSLWRLKTTSTRNKDCTRQQEVLIIQIH